MNFSQAIILIYYERKNFHKCKPSGILFLSLKSCLPTCHTAKMMDYIVTSLVPYFKPNTEFVNVFLRYNLVLLFGSFPYIYAMSILSASLIFL